MDFRNLCSKIDLDSIKAKFPPLPAIPQIRFPKSLPKLKSRKIFRSSREDIRRTSTKQQPQYPPVNSCSSSSVSLSAPIQPAEFIDRTPTRISTISSLMQEHSRGFRRGAIDVTEPYSSNTYRSAHSVDDDFSSPQITASSHTRFADGSLTDNPTKQQADSSEVVTTASGAKMSLAEKLQKGYKDISEFHFKNILARKTIVRQDNIVVNYYAQRYDEDRAVEDREREQRDLEIRDNYCFNFKESRQNSEVSRASMSPTDSPLKQARSLKKQRERPNQPRSLSEQSADESGMETTPPKRTVATRIASRNPRSLRRNDTSESGSADEYLNDDECDPSNQSITSSVWSIKKSTQRKSTESLESSKGRKQHKERMQRLTSSVSLHEDTDPELSVAENQQRMRRQQISTTSQQSLNEKMADSKTMIAIKQNLKRFKSSMSVKRNQTSTGTGTGTDTENRDAPPSADRAPTTQTKTTREKLASRFGRCKSHEAAIEETAEDENSPKKSKTNGSSPIRAALSNKLQTWTKSLKKKSGDVAATGTAEAEEEKEERIPEKQTHPGTLIKKLKYMRNRKNPSSVEDLDADDGLEGETNSGSKTTTSEHSHRITANLEDKFENARQRTLKKVSEKIQKMRVFYKSQENIEKKSPSENRDIGEWNAPPIGKKLSRGLKQDDENADDDEQSSEEHFPEVKSNARGEFRCSPKIHAAWTTKPILSDSTESEDNDIEYPRVLIHQDNSDAFESTLIISVTTAAPPSPRGARITEILPQCTTELPTEGGWNSERASETESTPPTTPQNSVAIRRTPQNTNNWIPNKDIISSFLEITTPKVQHSGTTDDRPEWTTPATCSVPIHTRNPSRDSSNSDSDSWIPEQARHKSVSRDIREESTAPTRPGLNRIPESEEPWRVHSVQANKKLYKTQSIDIFAENVKRGGVQDAFEDFDDELRNEPVMKILRKIHCETESNNSGEDRDADIAGDDDHDSSSRVTKVWAEDRRGAECIPLRGNKSAHFCGSLSEDSQRRQQIGNSRESLDANFDENDDIEYSDDDDDDDDYGIEDDIDRPPSTAPSPPPPFSPPPPPLPQRQPPLRRFSKPLIAEAEAEATSVPLPLPLPISPTLPPLPKTKPPPPPPTTNRTPPKVPERHESMARVAKPLVKTASLRLAYTERVKPGDVGKVNKLISRFEQPQPPTGQDSPTLARKLIAIRPKRSDVLIRVDSEDYFDQREQNYDDDDDDDDDDDGETYDDGDSVQAVEINSALKENELNNNAMKSKYEELLHHLPPLKHHPPAPLPPSSPPPPPPLTKQHSFNEEENVESLKKTKKRVAPRPAFIAVPTETATSTRRVEGTGTSKPTARDNDNNIVENFKTQKQISAKLLLQTQQQPERRFNIPKLTVTSDICNQNMPQSQTSSEYGSPLEYPSSLTGSAETTPTPDRRQQECTTTTTGSWRNASRKGRSLIRDDDQYFSFDSDEENSYYSISSAGSSRYVIEI